MQLMEAGEVALKFLDYQSLQRNVQSSPSAWGNYLCSSWYSLRLIIKQKMDQINISPPPSATKI